MLWSDYINNVKEKTKVIFKYEKSSGYTYLTVGCPYSVISICPSPLNGPEPILKFTIQN